MKGADFYEQIKIKKVLGCHCFYACIYRSRNSRRCKRRPEISYGRDKLGETVVSVLKPLQDRMADIAKDKAYVDGVRAGYTEVSETEEEE